MISNLEPKRVLITGASSGIGEALAYYYAAQGDILYLCGRDKGRLDQVAEGCRVRGGAVFTTLLDVTDKKALTGWIQAVDDDAPLDLVIANAGISGGTGGLGSGEDPDESREIWAINLHAKLDSVSAILPRMIKRKHGQIALMSSLAGFSGWPGAPSYAASKGAVRLYGEGLRGAVAHCGVKINVICPGFVKSRLTARNHYKMPFLMEAEKAAEIIGRGLSKNKGRIAFPWPTYLFAGLIGMLPYGLSLRLLGRMPRKPSSRPHA